MGGGGSIVDTIVKPITTIVLPAEDCKGSWSGYGACNKTCGGGTQAKTWTTTKNPKNGGAACPSPNTLSRVCNTQACPINCEGSWSGYGACDTSCGGGTKTQTWTTTKNPQHGGTACPSPATQSQECNTQPCPINCGGTWSNYTPCNESCGGGTQTRTWTTTTLPAHGGTACPSPTMELEECNTQACLTSAGSSVGSSVGPSAGPSAGPSGESADNDNELYIIFGTIFSVCCCILILILILILSMQGKPRIVRDYL
jgi:hypothetical protein